jgi:hypothetical protein
MSKPDIEFYKIHSQAVELFSKSSCKLCSIEISFDCDDKSCNGRMYNHKGFQLIESNWSALCFKCYNKLKLGEEFQRKYLGGKQNE